MRIWDISPRRLCRNHLLGEHGELHAVWNVLILNKKGYSKHPEILRWKGKLKAFYARHESLAQEIVRRGYRHKSPLDSRQARGSARQNQRVDSVQAQLVILKNKRCACDTGK
jgi:hypothetical protein